MMRDVRFAVRYLGRNWGTASVVVLSLALGMMATTALYSVIHAVVIDPFPYRDVDALMSVRVTTPGQRGGRIGYTTGQFLEIAERNTIFEGVVASTISDVLWTDAAEPRRLRGNYGTPNTFQIMGVPPLVGRAYGPADVAPAAPPVVVLGFRCWQRDFGGDPTVVGRSLRLDGQIRTVVGVMPKRFMWRGADVYLPVALRRGENVGGARYIHLLGRLKPGVSEAHAEADLQPIIADLKKREPAQFPDTWRVGLLSFKETFPSSIRQNLWIMFGAVGLLLLIACANVSNLLLAQTTGRRKEMIVRAALGAGRGRIVRQLLIESLLLAGAAGIAGVVLASASLRAILALVPPDTIPDEAEIALNGSVLVFTLLVSTATSLVFGLAPALYAASEQMAGTLRATSRTLTGGQGRLRAGLVVVEVALALMLLVAAGLMVRTLAAVQQADLGFRPERLLTFRVPLPEARYPNRERRVAFFEELLRRVGTVPGVSAVAVNTSMHPLGNLTAPVEVPATRVAAATAMVHQTSAGYAAAFDLPVTSGRFLSDADVQRADAVVVVNAAFVRTRMEGREPIGQRIRVPLLGRPPFSSPHDAFEIVGVVGDRLNTMDTSETGVDPTVLPEVYVPYTLTGLASRVVVLSRENVTNVIKPAVGQVYAIDPEQPATEVRPLDDLLRDQAYAEPRFNLVLFSVFALIGLTLAVVGVYGAMSSSVAQQLQELGVRLAIGASPTAVFGMVLARGGRLLAIGLAAGLAGSLFASRLLSSYVWRAATFDPPVIAGVSAVLAIAGMIACAWPARRAASVDPIVVLRQE